MRNIFFIFCFLIFQYQHLDAQSNQFYVDVEFYKPLERKTLILPAVSLNYVNNKNWGINMGVEVLNHFSDAAPRDRYTKIELFSTDYQNYTTSLHLRLLKRLNNKESKVRYNIGLGPSWMHFTEKTYFYSSGGWLSADKYTKRNVATIGLGCEVAVEFPFSRGFGLKTSILGNINNRHSYICLGVGIIAGRLR